jgi:hypothetical protein
MGNEDAVIIIIDDDSNLDTKPAAQDLGTLACEHLSPNVHSMIRCIISLVSVAR